MTDEIKRNPIEWFIKAFSVLTAGSFVFSGMMNGIVFWALWRLNYFLIATPSDVIMSAFLFGMMLTIGLIVSGLFVHLASKLYPVLDRAFGWLGGKLNFKHYPVAHKFTIADWTQLFSYLLVVTMIYLMAPVIRRQPPIWYQTGLQVSADVQFGSRACSDGVVEWLGASAAIVRCSSGVVVTHNLESLRTTPRFP